MGNQIDTQFNDLLTMFNDLEFDNARHMYFVNGENYPSVSKRLHDHCEEFDEEYWLERKAPQEKVSVEELRQRWHTKRDLACDKGHECHDFLEHFKPGMEHLADTPEKKAGVAFLMTFIYKDNPRYFIITQEFRMIHRLFKYCGTTDMLLWDSWTNTIIVADWKTNEDLFKTFGVLKYPFKFLESNPYNKYQLQFSYYQMMVEQSKYKVSQRWLIYLEPIDRENLDPNAEGMYTIHKTTDYTKDLTSFLKGETAAEFGNLYSAIW